MSRTRRDASSTLLSAYLDAEIGRIRAQSELRYAETRQHEADLVQYRAEAKKRIAEYYGVPVSSND